MNDLLKVGATFPVAMLYFFRENIYPFIHPFIHPSIHSFIHPSIHSSAGQSFSQTINQLVKKPIHPLLNSSSHPASQAPTHACMHPAIASHHPAIYPSSTFGRASISPSSNDLLFELVSLIVFHPTVFCKSCL